MLQPGWEREFGYQTHNLQVMSPGRSPYGEVGVLYVYKNSQIICINLCHLVKWAPVNYPDNNGQIKQKHSIQVLIFTCALLVNFSS